MSSTFGRLRSSFRSSLPDRAPGQPTAPAVRQAATLEPQLEQAPRRWNLFRSTHPAHASAGSWLDAAIEAAEEADAEDTEETDEQKEEAQ
eukprot:1709709-Prymnesium_polylepis.1